MLGREAAASRGEGMHVYHNSCHAMGSRLNVVLPHADAELCERLFSRIRAEVDRVESRLSRFQPGSDISRINRSAHRGGVALDDELFAILDTCLCYAELTGGAFDITLGQGGAGPAASHLHEIVLDREKRSIAFARAGIRLDLGGFGKGYALERIRPLLGAAPVAHAFISFGESSILVKGTHPHGAAWPVGIRDLYHPERPACSFALCDQALSSSSNYRVEDDGRLEQRAHVIDPCTGTPVTGTGIACVIGNSPLQAEILSTAFLVLDENRIGAVLDQLEERVEVVRISYRGTRATVTPVPASVEV